MIVKFLTLTEERGIMLRGGYCGYDFPSKHRSLYV